MPAEQSRRSPGKKYGDAQPNTFSWTVPNQHPARRANYSRTARRGAGRRNGSAVPSANPSPPRAQSICDAYEHLLAALNDQQRRAVLQMLSNNFYLEGRLPTDDEVAELVRIVVAASRKVR